MIKVIVTDEDGGVLATYEESTYLEEARRENPDDDEDIHGEVARELLIDELANDLSEHYWE